MHTAGCPVHTILGKVSSRKHSASPPGLHHLLSWEWEWEKQGYSYSRCNNKYTTNYLVYKRTLEQLDSTERGFPLLWSWKTLLYWQLKLLKFPFFLCPCDPDFRLEEKAWGSWCIYPTLSYNDRIQKTQQFFRVVSSFFFFFKWWFCCLLTQQTTPRKLLACSSVWNNHSRMVLTGQQRECSAWQRLQTRPSEVSDPPASPMYKVNQVLWLEQNYLFPSANEVRRSSVLLSPGEKLAIHKRISLKNVTKGKKNRYLWFQQFSPQATPP